MLGFKRKSRVDPDAHAAEEQRLLGVIWRSATSTRADDQDDATGLLAIMYGEPDAATAKLHAYADANGLDLSLLWPEPVADIGPHIRLPENADPARDWDRIVRAVGQNLGTERIARLDVDGGRWVARPLTARTLTLSNDAKPTDGERLDSLLGRDGDSLLRFDAWGRRAEAGPLDATTRRVRARLSDHIGVRPWEIDVTLGYDEDGDIALVVVDRAPTMSNADKRLKTWAEAITSVIPGGTAGWRVHDDAQRERVFLVYGAPERLPDLVPLADLLPDAVRPDEWNIIPLGIGTNGEPVFLNLTSQVHGLVVGATGSGKTILLLTWASQALMRGHEVVIIDPTKAGLDFATIRPWTVAWADTLPLAQATMERVYEEVTRRKAVLQQYGEVKWSDLNPQVRRAERINPVTVVLDEYASMVMEEPIPKGLDKQHPYVVDAQERNAARAIVASITGRVAREARFVGVHLSLGLQRPDAAIVSGEMRSNLTAGVQLSAPGKPPSREALTMLFPGETAAHVDEILRSLDDGKSRGLGVIAADGGQARGLRVGYAPARQIPELLTERGVPQPTPWTGIKNPAAEPTVQPIDFNPFGNPPEPDPEPLVDTGFTLDATPEPGAVDLSHLVTDVPADDLWA